MTNEGKFMGIKIDNHVSVGHIFTTLSAIIAGVLVYANMESRITSLEKSDVRIEKRIDDQKQDTKELLDRMEIKIDKIYDKVVGAK
jgi:hypothetical protein